MQTLNMTEFRSHLPEYISRAAAGEAIMITRLLPVKDRRTAAKEQLTRLRARALVGDGVSPVEADGEASR